jgi:hypothetical protein
MRRRISSTILVEMLPDFSRSKASNAFFSTAKKKKVQQYVIFCELSYYVTVKRLGRRTNECEHHIIMLNVVFRPWNFKMSAYAYLRKFRRRYYQNLRLILLTRCSLRRINLANNL